MENIKRAYIIIMLFATLFAVSRVLKAESQVNLVLEFGRTHYYAKNIGIFENNNPSLIGLEFHNKDTNNSIDVFYMKNTFYNDSCGVTFNHYFKIKESKFSVVCGAGLASGYGLTRVSDEYYAYSYRENEYANFRKPELLIANEYAVLIFWGLNYKIDDKNSLNLINFGSCFSLILKTEI